MSGPIPAPGISRAEVLALIAAAGGDGSGRNMGTPATTAAAGTPTVAAVETRDAVLGDYTFMAVAGRRYRAVVDGIQASATVASDCYLLRIRNGGAATPTAASAEIAVSSYVAKRISVGETLPLSATFIPGAGLVTLSVFMVRTFGASIGFSSSKRELYAVDIGPA